MNDDYIVYYSLLFYILCMYILTLTLIIFYIHNYTGLLSLMIIISTIVMLYYTIIFNLEIHKLQYGEN